MARILFVLPAGGYSGGANSVVQETKGLLRLGVDASIAVDRKNVASFRRCYATQFDVLNQIIVFDDYGQLERLLAAFDVVVATIGTLAAQVFDAVRNATITAKREIRPAYYIQDYEPLFFDAGSQEWALTRGSYETSRNVVFFAKTDWICRMVERNHGVAVRRVLPSIDHDCYVPGETVPSEIVVSAMIRPNTSRRAPKRTARILGRLAEHLRGKVRVVSFGCGEKELIQNGILLHGAIQHQGQLTREQVAQVLRESSLFLDLSDYQAFGRTGIESMACGAVPVMPIFGGAPEFVTHAQNGYLVDTRYDSLVLDVIDQYIALPDSRRRRMRSHALETAAEYNVHRAAVSMRNLLFEESA